MTLYSDLTWALTLVCAGFLLAGAAVRKPWQRTAFGCAFAAAVYLVPAGPTALVGHLKGLQFEPSLGTVLIFAAVVSTRMRDAAAPATRPNHRSQPRGTAERTDQLRKAVFFLCCAVYPMALGLGPFDAYALGFNPWTAVAAVLAALLLAWFRGAGLVPWWIILGTLAYLFRLGESRNLVDYLVDPIAFGAGIAWAAGRLSGFGRRLTRAIPWD